MTRRTRNTNIANVIFCNSVTVLPSLLHGSGNSCVPLNPSFHLLVSRFNLPGLISSASLSKLSPSPFPSSNILNMSRAGSNFSRTCKRLVHDSHIAVLNVLLALSFFFQISAHLTKTRLVFDHNYHIYHKTLLLLYIVTESRQFFEKVKHRYTEYELLTESLTTIYKQTITIIDCHFNF